MSVTQFTPDARLEDHPPSGFLQRIAAILTALLLLTGSIVLGITPSAHAATAGVGYWSGNSFLGAFNPGMDGRQA